MRLFACCFLFIFITGNVLSEVNRKCGGKIDILRERSGSIIYSFPGGVQPTSVIYNRVIDYGIGKQPDAICTWIIDARVNQTVWIEVIHVDEDAQLRIQFSNDTAVKKHEKGARMLFSGAGRTTVEWSLRNVPSTLNLRWNTSEDSHDLAQVPYTHSDSDPVSPSPDSTNRVTRTPDKPGFKSVSPHTHTLRGTGAQQGGGVSGPNDKSRPPFPQENAHNEQEKAGTVISNLTHTALLAHAGTHTHSSGSYTHTHAQTVTQTIPALLLPSAETQSPQVSRHNLALRQDVATATAAYLNTNGDNAAYRLTTTNELTRDSPSTGMHIATNVYSDKHNSIENAPLSPTIPMARSHTVSSVHSDRDPKASDAPVFREQDFYTVTYTSDNKMTAPTDGRVSTVAASGSKNQPPATTTAASPDSRALGTETGRTNRYPRSSQTNQENSNRTNLSVFEDSDAVTGTSVSVTHDQAKRSVLTDQYTAVKSHGKNFFWKTATSSTKATEHTFVEEHHTHGLYHTLFPNTYMPRDSHPTKKVESQDSMDTYISHTRSTISRTRSTIAQQTSSPLQPNASNQLGSTESFSLSTQRSTNRSGVFGVTTPSDLPVSPVTSVEGETKHHRHFSFTSAPKSPNMGSQDGEREEMNSNVFPSTMTVLTVHPSPQINPAVTPDLTNPTPPESSNEGSTVSPSSALSAASPSSALSAASPSSALSAASPSSALSAASPSSVLSAETHTPSPQETELYAHKWQQDVPHTLGPQLSSPAMRRPTETDAAMHQSTPFTPMDHSGPGSHGNSSRSGVLLDPRSPISFSPSVRAVTGSVEATRGAWTLSNDRVTPTAAGHVITLSSVGSTAGEAVNTRRPLYKDINQTQVTHSPLTTPPWPKPTPTRHQDSRSTPTIQTYGPVEQLGTRTLAVQKNTNPSDPTGAYPPFTAAVTHTPWLRPFTVKNDKDWSHKGRDFIVEDQPVAIKVENFQVLLQVVLEQNSSFPVGLMEVEPFLHRVAGYQHQLLTWHSGPVVQTVVTFNTMEAFSWLGRAESLLSQARLSPLPKEGLFVGGVRVKNITVGGLHSDVCSWLFECPPGFQCETSEGNASCTSVCHSEYCRHHGICVHRPGEPPLCQCPVGEDFWFMGRRCDLRMTRQRLVGMCVGVLGVAAALMALLSYLAVRRFKTMMIQAKVDQTRSSYRRFNHFDELSARFWGRSWPGSEDSLDNPAFTHSDELLHMRALDRTCCYHDDTLSVASTYQGSATHLSTVYPHSSQYHWNLSNCSLADCVIDSGKASDLSVCSWPIEPIQWTPFPLLQQLNRNVHSVKVSRPRSYCEGMELVDLEKSWTA